MEAGQTLRKVKLVKQSGRMASMGWLNWINQGYHCYVESFQIFRENYYLVRVTVPKGTRYYSNGYELVAEKIIVNEEAT